MKEFAYDKQDYEKNKVLASLGYLVFFLPLIACPGSKYGRFCANQGLIMTLGAILLRVACWLLRLLLGWFAPLKWLINAVGALGSIAIGMLALYMLYEAIWQGKAFKVPFLGDTTIIS